MVVATRDMPIGTLLKKSDLKLVNYPEKDVPKGSIFQLAGARKSRADGSAQHQRAGAAR